MIETATIGPLTSEEVNDKGQEAEADLRSRMRGLAQAVQNLREYDEWNDKTSIPWVLTAAQSATGGINQVGHIGLSPNIYTTTPYQTISTGPSTDYNMKVEQSGQIDIRGEKADIRINGKSMNKWMEQVEQRLNILSPNPELEKEWDDLRRLGERYRKLEKKCQEKAKMWEALKKLPKVKP